MEKNKILNRITTAIKELEAEVEEEKNKEKELGKRLRRITKEKKEASKIAADTANLFSPYEKKSQLKELEVQVEAIQEKVLESELIRKKREKELENLRLVKVYIEEKEEEVIDKKGDKKIEQQERENQISAYRILEIQELERKRISMDLHDTTVQNLTTLVHKTELITKLIDMDSVRAKLELQTSLGTVRDTIKELREIIYDLRPMSIDDLGIAMAVEHFAKQMEFENNEIQIDVETKNFKAKNVLPVINMSLYRIIQEAYNNVKKHSRATYVTISISSNKTMINLTIEDNGCGFDVKTLREKNKNFGISIMQERINLLSGEFALESKIGKGTKIVVSIPLVEEENNE